MSKQNWIWMPHAGHFILGHMCRFRLNTYVNGYIVSTVGEYVPDSAVREILNECRGGEPLSIGDLGEQEYLERYEFENIGADRKYETMVFRATKTQFKCCPYRLKDTDKIDFEGYNTADEAYQGHLKMCKKYDKKTK